MATANTAVQAALNAGNDTQAAAFIRELGAQIAQRDAAVRAAPVVRQIRETDAAFHEAEVMLHRLFQ